MAVLGIDLGTSSVKVIVLDDRGRTLGESRADYAVKAPQQGWAESDPGEWWSSTLSAVQAAVARASRAGIGAIGLSGQMHGGVPTTEDGQATRAALLWADTRAEAELARYQALPAAARRCLANPLAPGMASPLLCCLARQQRASSATAS